MWWVSWCTFSRDRFWLILSPDFMSYDNFIGLPQLFSILFIFLLQTWRLICVQLRDPTFCIFFRSSTGKKTAYVPTKDIPSDQVLNRSLTDHLSLDSWILGLMQMFFFPRLSGPDPSHSWSYTALDCLRRKHWKNGFSQVIVTEKTNILLR